MLNKRSTRSPPSSTHDMTPHITKMANCKNAEWLHCVSYVAIYRTAILLWLSSFFPSHMLKVQAAELTIRLSWSLVVQTFDQLFVKEEKENPLYASTAWTLAVVTNRCKKTCRINWPGTLPINYALSCTPGSVVVSEPVTLKHLIFTILKSHFCPF